MIIQESLKIRLFKTRLKRTVLMIAVFVLSFASLAPFATFNQASALESWETAGWDQVSIGDSYACAVSNGQAYCWGYNRYQTGSLGSGSVGYVSTTPVAVDTTGVLAGKTILSISAGDYHACATASDNQAYCWGAGAGGRLGNNSTVSSSVPVAVDTTGVLAGKTILSISADYSHACAVASDNQAYCWGAGAGGRLGNNSTVSSSVPVAVDTTGVLAGKTILSISAGYSHTCAVASDNQVYCWGDNYGGTLGNNTVDDSLTPVAVDTTGVLAGKTILSISAGSGSTCAIASDNQVYCWGDNYGGMLGNNTVDDSLTPVAVDTAGALAGKVVSSVNAGSGYACAIADNKSYCWGAVGTAYYYGQLGNNSLVGSLVPVAVDATGALAGKTVLSIDVGIYHTCAIASDNQIYCWGANFHGELGNNDSSDSWVPVRVVAATPSAIADINFTDQGGMSTLTINGEGFGFFEIWEILSQPSVILNGTSLPFCSKNTGDVADVFDNYAHQGYDYTASDTPTCFMVILDENTWEHGFTPKRAVIWLADDFDTTAPGTLSVSGSPLVAFNQPAPTVSGQLLTDTPTIAERPTFTGVASAGSIVTVTVNSDPVTCTTTADSNGNWSCTLPSDLPAGNHTVNVVVVTPDDQTLTYGPYAVTVAADGSSDPITDGTPLAPDSGAEPVHKLFWLMIGGAGTALLVCASILALRNGRQSYARR